MFVLHASKVVDEIKSWSVRKLKSPKGISLWVLPLLVILGWKIGFELRNNKETWIIVQSYIIISIMQYLKTQATVNENST
jgi:hypothetical protein